ncbi:MAG: sulfatase [Planctomycetota bacterium]|jgi:iduronate 2-sulfatase
MLRLLALSVLCCAITAADKPNVLFIMVDDLKPPLGCYGDTYAQTPNFDRLAALSVQFNEAYCQVAVCAPSRAGVMAGVRPESIGLFNISQNFAKLQPDFNTISRHFRDHGWHSQGLGKVYHHEDDSYWSTPMPSLGADTLQHPSGSAGKARAEGKLNTIFEHDGPDEDFLDGRLTNELITIMSERQAADEPFFLVAGYKKPHLPFEAPKACFDRFDLATVPMPEVTEPPANSPSFTGHSWGEMQAYTDVPRGIHNEGGVGEAKTRELIRAYYACVALIDNQIGKILDHLETSGLIDNTIIVLWGDHGWHLGDHGWWCKHTNFQQAARIPMMVRAPGMTPAISSAYVESVDIYPTLCQLAGIPTPGHVEGTSMVPVLEQPDRSWKSGAFHCFHRGDMIGWALVSEGVRYVEWRRYEGYNFGWTREKKVPLFPGINQTTGEFVDRELYDLHSDPLETRNVASDPAYADQIERLSQRLRGGWQGALPASN